MCVCVYSQVHSARPTSCEPGQCVLGGRQSEEGQGTGSALMEEGREGSPGHWP